MREISLHFADFYPGFDPRQNMFYYYLSRHYGIRLDAKNPEFVICAPYGIDHLKYKNSIKIVWVGESMVPDFNQYDYALGLYWLDFGDRYLKMLQRIDRKPLAQDGAPEKRKFCNFIYHNHCMGEGARLRKEFCKLLAEYKHVDCPGVVLNNMKNALAPRYGDREIMGDSTVSKEEFISGYKFTIAFENTLFPGYSSEKLWQPLKANSVPIYWGDPEAARIYNQKAFINCHNFATLDDMVQEVIRLDNDDEAYLAMLKEPPMNPEIDPKKHSIEDFLVNIVENGKIQRNELNDYYANLPIRTYEKALSALKNKVLGPLFPDLDGSLDDIFADLPYAKDPEIHLEPLARRSSEIMAKINASEDSIAKREEEAIAPYFDSRFYLEHYPDVRENGMDALTHYVQYGAKEDRMPAPWFDAAKFVAENPFVREKGYNPFLFYLEPQFYLKKTGTDRCGHH